MKRNISCAILTLSLILGIQFQANSQKLQVFDFVSGKPVENVALYNQKRTTSVITNQKGSALLDEFARDDTIYFQHPSYQKIEMTLADLSKINFKVFLKKEVRMLEEFVISVSKWEQNKREIPNKIRALSDTEIQFNNPQTAADLVGISNEVFIQKSQLGGGSPMIRGFSANAVLLVVDGVRMNNAIYRSGNLQNVISLDANSIERSEVIFGPGSVIYGSDALGGVMDFHTKWVSLSTKDKPQLSVNALVRYSSANHEKTGHLDANIGGDKWAFLSSFSRSDYDDLRMGSRKNPDYQRPEYVIRKNNIDTIIQNKDPDIQKFSGYNQVNLLEKIRYRPNENLNLIYAFHYSKLSTVPRYDRLIEYGNDQLKYATWDYGPQEWMMHSIRITYDKANTFFTDAQLTLAYQDYEESRIDRKFGKSGVRERTEEVDILSLNLDFDKKFKKENVIFYGVEITHNDVTSTAFEKDLLTGTVTPAGTRYPDGDNVYKSLAAYLSYKNNINAFLTFNTGLRFNYTSLHSTIIDTSIYHFPYDEIDLGTGAINGSLGLVYRPNDRWQVNLNGSSGFRAPNLDDVGKIFDSEPGSVVVPNKNLKPEYTYNLDLGTVASFRNNSYFEATVFITFLRDAMVRREFQFNMQDSILYDGTMSKVYAVVNADKALIYGGNISFGIDLTRFLHFSNTLTFTIGEDQDGIPFRHVAPLFGSTHLILKTEKIKVDFHVNFNGEKSAEMLAPSEQSKLHMYALDNNGDPYSPGWYTLNLKTAYQITRKIQLNAGIENILDHRYRPYSSGIVAPGRNLFFTVRFTI
jgi:hemoglobin/transferrin/lactoferrin receptor protein